MENTPRQRRLFKRYDAFEIKELKKVAASDRRAVASHPDFAKTCAELERLGFSDFSIAEGLAMLANEYRQRAQDSLTE